VGGPQKKKFFYGPFKQLLTEIHTQPMEEQRKKLETTTTEWRGGIEQVDDITILGIRFN
jgi:serine phosphatase RsbU (regulator of sigma subunit)